MARSKPTTKAKRPAAATLDLSEIGSSGLKRSGGVLAEEFDRDLRGSKGVRAYQEMQDVCMEVAAGLFLYELLLRQVQWRVEPFDAAIPAAVERAEFVDGVLRDMSSPLDTVFAEILTMLPFGWSYLEEVYKVRRGPDPGSEPGPDGKPVPLPPSKFNDGLIGWRKLALRAQDTLLDWDLDPNGGIQGMRQMDQSTGGGIKTVPIGKALLFRTKSIKNNPEGRSILRAAYPAWRFLKRLKEYEAIGVARDVNGVPKGYVPPEAFAKNAPPEMAAAKTEIERIVTALVADEMAGLVLPAIFDAKGNRLIDVVLMTNEGKRNFDTDPIIRRYRQEIATSMLTAVQLLGQDKIGTQALAQEGGDTLMLAMNAIADSVADVFNQFGFPRLMRLNGWPAQEAPRLVPSKIKKAPTLTEMGDWLKALTGAGMPLFPDDNLENDLRARGDMPTKSEEM